MKPLTKNRAELLRLFFTNPARSFYMQEIGRILGRKPGAFQRTLNNMVLEGILQSEYRAHARYFKANTNYPLYKELKSIVFKTVGVQGSLRELLDRIGGVTFAFIYGSYARGEENYLSDVDLVIVGKPNEDILIAELDRLEERLKRDINYKLYTLRGIKRDIKERAPFVIRILKEKKIMVVGTEDELRTILER